APRKERVERAQAAVGWVRVAADDIGAQANARLQRGALERVPRIRRERPGEDVVVAELAELSHAFEVVVPSPLLTVEPRPERVAQLVLGALHELAVRPAQPEVIQVDLPTRKNRQRVRGVDAPEAGPILPPVVERARIVFNRPRNERVDLPILDVNQEP